MWNYIRSPFSTGHTFESSSDDKRWAIKIVHQKQFSVENLSLLVMSFPLLSFCKVFFNCFSDKNITIPPLSAALNE